jgi:hypothetical protein
MQDPEIVELKIIIIKLQRRIDKLILEHEQMKVEIKNLENEIKKGSKNKNDN